MEMLDQQSLRELLPVLEVHKRPQQPLCIWVTGLSASGKTFVANGLNKMLSTLGTTAMLSDAEKLLRAVKSDSQRKYHVAVGNGFLVTDTKLHDQALRQLMAEVKSFTGDYLLVELARGVDITGQVDFSYRCFSSYLTNDITHRSLFLYLSCPYEQRIQRNARRPTTGVHRRINSVAFERYHQTDDFVQWSKEINAPIMRLEN